MPSLLQPLHQIPIAVIDVETTGASADYGHRVIELGIVRIEGGKKVAEYQQLYDPQRRLSPGITALTGITPAMLVGQPRFIDQLDRITPLLSGAMILGHNVRFDLSFINREYRRCGKELAAVLGPGVHVLDTVRIARRRFGRGGNGLGRLALRLGVEQVTAHRALADAQTTHLVFEQLMHPVGGWSICLCDCLREQGGPMGLMPISAKEDPLPLELEEALEQRRPVLMIYLDARKNRTERLINPLRIRRAGGEMILIAHCHLRGDQRTFKVERIVEMRRIEESDISTPANLEFQISNSESPPGLFDRLPQPTVHRNERAEDDQRAESQNHAPPGAVEALGDKRIAPELPDVPHPGGNAAVRPVAGVLRDVVHKRDTLKG
jgi:DNA polymerase III epsilon subunit family exonuclease